MKLIYPAILYKGESGAYAIEVPDLPGCATGGDTLEEAISMGEDAASGWVLDELEHGRPIPPASEPSALNPEEGGFVTYLPLDMTAYAAKHGGKSVRKNLSIPAWLAAFAESRHINYSSVLQEALTGLYNQTRASR